MRISLTLKGDKGKDIIKCANDTLRADIRIGNSERLPIGSLVIRYQGEALGQEHTAKDKRRGLFTIELQDHNGKALYTITDVAL